MAFYEIFDSTSGSVFQENIVEANNGREALNKYLYAHNKFDIRIKKKCGNDVIYCVQEVLYKDGNFVSYFKVNKHGDRCFWAKKVWYGIVAAKILTNDC